MKLYSGNRFCYLRQTTKRQRRFLSWVLNLKPGDTFAACTGLNHSLASMNPIRENLTSDWNWRTGKDRRVAKGWAIIEIELTDTNGGFHCAGSGGGCVSYPESAEQIRAYWRAATTPEEMVKSKELGWWGPFSDYVAECFRTGKDFVDSRGLLLSEAHNVWMKRSEK